MNTPVGVSRPLPPVETVDAAMGKPLRYSKARCVVRSITRNSGPAEAALASQTYWPGRSRVAFSTTDRSRCLAGCAPADVAAHARNPNAISRLTGNLVQAIAPRTSPIYRRALYW